MKKNTKILSEGIIDKFVRNVFDNIADKRRQINKKALQTDPELKAAEEKLAKAYDSFFAAAKKRNARR